ncbi:MAG: T9SS type A sorting domain-containing protein [Bacteroidota bacterium]
MNKALLLLLFISISLFSNSQDTVYSKTYGGNAYETAVGIDTLSNKNAIIFGNTSSFGNGNMDLLVFGINSIGKIRWQKYYGTNDLDQATSYCRTKDNNYVICGTTNRNDGKSYDIWIIKVDSLGNKLWEKTYGSIEWDFAKDIAEDENNNLFICGQTFNQSNTGDAFVLKLNNVGDSIWWKQMNANKTDVANAIIASKNSVYIAGESTSFASDSIKTSFCAKLDDLGNFLFQKTFCDTSENVAYDIINYSDTLLIVGYIVQANLKKTQYIIIADTTGQLLSQFNYENTSNYEITKIKRNPAGRLDFLGHTDINSGGKQDIYYLRMNRDFYFITAGTYGKWDNDYAADFCELPNKQFMVLGTTNSFENVLSAIYLLKTDTNLFAPLNAINMPLSTNSIHENYNITVFPNPSNDYIYISTDLVDISECQISVINSIGQNCNFNIYNHSKNKIAIDISSLKEGFYLVRLTNENICKDFKIRIIK